MSNVLRSASLITRFVRRASTVPSVKVVADDVPIVVKRAATKAVKEATKLEKSKQSRSTFSQRITPFLWGFVLMSFGGMYLLKEDLKKSNMELSKALMAVKNDKDMQLVQLEDRIEQLEDALK
ncbi:hypothetical protein WA556_000187 [Blastocystis sp. ATCC 50177/Nand II]